MKDGLTRIEQEELFNKMEDQYKQGEEGLSQEDAYLLEFDFESLWSKTGRQKKYWLQAIESARTVAQNMSDLHDDAVYYEEEHTSRPRRRGRRNPTTRRARKW